MRFVASSCVAAALVAVMLAAHAVAQPGITSVCPCPDPPGGTCSCEPGQIAICKVVNGRCSGTCFSRRAELSDAQNAVRLAEAITGVTAKEVGFDPSGKRINETLSGEALSLLNDMLQRRQNNTRFEAQLPPRYRVLNPAGATPVVQDPRVTVNIPEDVVRLLKETLPGLASGGQAKK